MSETVSETEVLNADVADTRVPEQDLAELDELLETGSIDKHH